MRTMLPMRRLKGAGGLPGPPRQPPDPRALRGWPAGRRSPAVDFADPEGTRVYEWRSERWVDITGSDAAEEAVALAEANNRKRGEAEG